MTTKERVREKIHEATGVPAGSIVYGRPIMLHDVLRAIDTFDEEGTYITVHINGEIMHNDVPQAKWNLSLPFDEQSDEVVEFIGKVLGA